MIWGGGLSNLPYHCWGARLFGRVGPWQTRVQMAGDTVLGVPARGSTALGSIAGGGWGAQGEHKAGGARGSQSQECH